MKKSTIEHQIRQKIIINQHINKRSKISYQAKKFPTTKSNQKKKKIYLHAQKINQTHLFILLPGFNIFQSDFPYPTMLASHSQVSPKQDCGSQILLRWILAKIDFNLDVTALFVKKVIVARDNQGQVADDVDINHIFMIGSPYLPSTVLFGVVYVDLGK